MEKNVACEIMTKPISSYLNDKFLEIIGKYFRRVCSDCEYFYFYSEDERLRQSRSSLEMDDRVANGHNEIGSSSGPYKFEENLDENHDDHSSNGTVHYNDLNDDDDLDSTGRLGRRRSDVSSTSLSNRSREFSTRTEILPFFLCFSCRLKSIEIDETTPIETIPVCISSSREKFSSTSKLFVFSFSAQILPNKNNEDLRLDGARMSFSLVCMTFAREDFDGQNLPMTQISSATPTFNSFYLNGKRHVDIDTVETVSTCTVTTVVADSQK